MPVAKGTVTIFAINGSKKFKKNFMPTEEIKAPKFIININLMYLFVLLSFLL